MGACVCSDSVEVKKPELGHCSPAPQKQMQIEAIVSSGMCKHLVTLAMASVPVGVREEIFRPDRENSWFPL